MYILYNRDTGGIVSPIVYSDYEIAVTDANIWNRVMILKVEEPTVKEEKESDELPKSN